MIGYGLAKAAVHQLTKSLAEETSGLPKDSLVVSILPITLDTPMNRKWMPQADHSTWTPLDFIAEYVTHVTIMVYRRHLIRVLLSLFLERLQTGRMEVKDPKMAPWFALLRKTTPQT